MKNILFFILFVAVTITSCRKDEFNEDATVIVVPSGEDVTTTVNGLVKTSSNTPAADVLVQIGDQSVITDENGYFIIPNVNVDSKGFAAKASGAFYTTNIVRVTPIENSNTYVEIVVNFDIRSSTFLGSEGGVVSDTIGSILVTIPPNSMQDEFGNDYPGEITASLFWYSPNWVGTLNTMPGNLEGIDSEGNAVTLGTLGMISAEFTSVEGQDLNLKPGSIAQVTMHIPEEMQEGAPDEVPIWSLDEEFGVWIEEGIAFKEENSYVFDVTHFSFWNCDAPFPVVKLEGTVKDTDGNPIINSAINLSFFDGVNFISRVGYTNDDGVFSGKVPRGVELTLTIVNNNCLGLLHEETIGPYTADNNNVEIVVNSLSTSFNIEGTITDCDGNTISTGTVFLEDPNGKVLASVLSDEIGYFKFLNVCEGNSFGLKAVDYSTLKVSATLSFDPIVEDFDAGILLICDELMNYIDVKTEIGDLLFINPTVSIGGIDTLSISEENNEGFVSIFIASPVNGINNEFATLSLFINGQDLFCFENCLDILEFNITNYNPDEKIAEGTIEGEMFINEVEQVEINIEYKINLE